MDQRNIEINTSQNGQEDSTQTLLEDLKTIDTNSSNFRQLEAGILNYRANPDEIVKWHMSEDPLSPGLFSAGSLIS